MPLYLGAVALYFAFRRKWWVALGIGGVSTAYGFLLWRALIPSLRSWQPLPYLTRWSEFGNTIPDVLVYFLTHPAELLTILLSVHLFNLFAGFGFLPLLCPTAILPTIPPLFVNLSSAFEPQRHLALYYSAPILPFLAWATLRGLHRVHLWMKGDRLVRGLILALILLNLGYAKVYAVTDRDRTGHSVIGQIPHAASVATQAHLVPHLSKREAIYIIGKTWDQHPVEYVLLDVKDGFWPVSREDLLQLANRIDDDPQYEKVLERNGYLLFRRRI